MEWRGEEHPEEAQLYPVPLQPPQGAGGEEAAQAAGGEGQAAEGSQRQHKLTASLLERGGWHFI